MLLPALNKARAKAHATSCVNKLKQMGTAASLYMADHEDYILLCYSGESSYNGTCCAGGPFWQVRMAPYLNLKLNNRWWEVPEATAKWFHCPAKSGETIINEYAQNYMVTAELSERQTKAGINRFENPKLHHIKQPSYKIFLLDVFTIKGDDYKKYVFNPSPNNRFEQWSLIHSGGVNFLHFDGSVGWSLSSALCETSTYNSGKFKCLK